MVQILPLMLLSILLFSTCSGEKSKNDNGTATDTSTGLHPIDIKASEFFWLIQPWKEGKLATIDGKGRFAEISFIGASKLRVTPFGNFPQAQFDRQLITWPSAGLIASTTGKMYHLAAVDDNKTKSHVPLLSWVHRGTPPVLLDSHEGLVSYSYRLIKNDNDVDICLFVYNYKEDKMVYEGPEEGFFIRMTTAIDTQNVLSLQRSFNGKEKEFKTIFFNWRTHEVVENDLTKALNINRVDIPMQHGWNINLEKRYLFGRSNTIKQVVKVSWDEDYSDITVTPLSYFLPEGKYFFDDFIISVDGLWATTFVGGYRGLYNERLEKRAFFHLDGRYPNGISIPIITEDYEDYSLDYSAFVEHPVHGMCFAQEWHKEGGLYLRLYKMSKVLTEIERGLLEKEEGAD
jgi:hypothetical protein